MSDYGSTPPPPPPPPGSGSGDGGYSAPPPGSGDGGYGTPPPMGGGQIEHPKGMTILILGILSLVCCSPLGIAAFVMGNNALKEIDAQPGRYSNRQLVQIGRILGIIGMVLLVLSLLWILLFGGLAVLSGGSSSSY